MPFLLSLSFSRNTIRGQCILKSFSQMSQICQRLGAEVRAGWERSVQIPKPELKRKNENFAAVSVDIWGLLHILHVFNLEVNDLSGRHSKGAGVPSKNHKQMREDSGHVNVATFSVTPTLLMTEESCGTRKTTLHSSTTFCWLECTLL